MVIDTHIHPALFEPICKDKNKLNKRLDEMNYHLMSPSGIDLLKKQYRLADIEKVFLLPEDCSFETKIPAISNDEIKLIVDYDPGYFLGFASVDPRNSNAKDELVRAFESLDLKGLFINTARLHLYPNDPKLMELYDICERYGKPIIFHSGMTLENNALAKFSRPIDFEEILDKYSTVNICLTHVGWPWVQETASLLLKYPNCYTNTALMNFDGPYQIYEKVFKKDMDEYWVEHNISNKIMFGSDSPRIRPVRSKRGLDNLNFSEDTLEKIYYKNALKFLDLEE